MTQQTGLEALSTESRRFEPPAELAASANVTAEAYERAQTDRLIRAVQNPRLTILGHATGRLLLGRSGYPVDVRAVIDAAAENGVAVEINADPRRLDIDWRHARYAAQRGVLVPINPDAHSVAGLDNVAWGISVARKAWLPARGVLNTWELKEVEDYFAQRKQARKT